MVDDFFAEKETRREPKGPNGVNFRPFQGFA